MIKPRKGLKKNNRGSVLLAVTCMTMVCMTLVTIALAVVNQTTKRSSSNVQKAQAKVTAESVLTEFVSNYYAQNYTSDTTVDNGDDPYRILSELSTGSSFETGYQINVDTSTLSEDLGSCEMSIYDYDDGFKIEVQCTYGTQTQTASAYFQTDKVSNPVTSAAIESANGVNISEGSVNGDIFVEQGTSSDTWYTLPHAYYRSHIYSEISMTLYTTTKVLDETNKTRTLVFDHDTTYFQQAPTITTKGYLYSLDSCSITTEVGKTDVNGHNRNDTTKSYDENNLGNYDGYIYTMKKFINTYNGSALTIGDSDNDIDVYCRGAYIGAIPKSIDGNDTDYSTIMTASSNGVSSGCDGSFTMYGNFYSYKKDTGASDGTVTDGNVVIGCDSHAFTVNGDMFVDGNIYLLGNSKLTVTGTLYCTGTIYTACSYADGAVTTNAATSTTINDDGSLSNTSVSSTLTCGGFSKVIDTTVQRNKMPDEGYDPATGKTSSSGSRLSSSDKYGTSTSNYMFSYSLPKTTLSDGTEVGGDSDDNDAAANIAVKYAEAMSRTVDSTYVNSDGDTKDVVSFTGYYGDYEVYDINSSVRLTSNDGLFGSSLSSLKNYIVRLTDSDIVIALPMGSSYTNAFRIDRSGITDGNEYYCYFMFYAEDGSGGVLKSDDGYDICYYSTVYSPDTTQVLSIGMSDGSVYQCKTATADQIANASISFGGSNITIAVSDFSLTAESDGAGGLSQDVEANMAASSFNEDQLKNAKNYIMYLVPNSVSFTVNNGSGHGYIQGVIYAPLSNVTVSGSANTKYMVYGQIKAGYLSVTQCSNSSVGGIVYDLPMDDGSIFDFVQYQQKSTNSGEQVKIQYYQY